MRNFVHIYEELDMMYLGKPQGMYPVYMKLLGWNSKIVTYNLKKDLPDNFRGVEIVKIKQLFSSLPNENILKFIKRLRLYYFIYKNAENIDVLMLYHLTKCSYWNSFFYRLKNKKGKIFIKGDFDFPEFQGEVKLSESKPKSISEFFRIRRWKKEFKKRKIMAKMMNVFSVETLESYEGLKKFGYAGIDVKNKLLHLPNGFDLDFVEKNKIIRKSFEEKENIIFTASRLGTKEKNTEFFLDVISKLELKDWKVVLAGPVTEKFQIKVEEFFIKNPKLKEKVIFLGFIKDKNILYSYYNKAKIFMMTSRGEGFANVFLEALYFGNYIITTKVSSAEDVTNNNTIGSIISQGKINEYVEKLQYLINNQEFLEKKYLETIDYSKNFLWIESAKKLNKKLSEENND